MYIVGVSDEPMVLADSAKQAQLHMYMYFLQCRMVHKVIVYPSDEQPVELYSRCLVIEVHVSLSFHNNLTSS